MNDVKGLSDSELMDRAARYNAQLRQGRRMVDEGNAIISAAIDPFVACQNEFYSRISQRLEKETDGLDERRPKPRQAGPPT